LQNQTNNVFKAVRKWAAFFFNQVAGRIEVASYQWGWCLSLSKAWLLADHSKVTSPLKKKTLFLCHPINTLKTDPDFS